MFRRSYLNLVQELRPPGGLVPLPPKPTLKSFIVLKSDSIVNLADDLSNKTDPLTLDEVDTYYYKCTNARDTHYFSASTYLKWCERSFKCTKCPIDFSRMDFHLYQRPEQ